MRRFQKADGPSMTTGTVATASTPTVAMSPLIAQSPMAFVPLSDGALVAVDHLTLTTKATASTNPSASAMIATRLMALAEPGAPNLFISINGASDVVTSERIGRESAHATTWSARSQRITACGIAETTNTTSATIIS